jgi:hypothetical protein
MPEQNSNDFIRQFTGDVTRGWSERSERNPRTTVQGNSVAEGDERMTNI